MDGFPRGVTMFGTDTSPEALIGSGRATQHTLKSPIDCVGVGLHSGARVALALRPAPAGHGIVFRRRDLGVDIPARFDHVSDTRLCTVLAHPTIPGARIGTVEHIMAALAATGITNAVVEVDGPEIPIFDGSAANLIFLIDCAGIEAQDAPQSAIAIARNVRVDGPDGAWVELLPPTADTKGPNAGGLDARISIDFAAPAIGAQSLALRITSEAIRRDLAPARTFCLLAEVEAMQAAGLARGGSLDNAVVVDGARVLNPAGLRMQDEFVRHKLLDMVGDLALSGAALHGRLRAHRPGHALNNQLLRRLFADAANWRQLAGTPPIALSPPLLAARA